MLLLIKAKKTFFLMKFLPLSLLLEKDLSIILMMLSFNQNIELSQYGYYIQYSTNHKNFCI